MQRCPTFYYCTRVVAHPELSRCATPDTTARCEVCKTITVPPAHDKRVGLLRRTKYLQLPHITTWNGESSLRPCARQPSAVLCKPRCCWDSTARTPNGISTNLREGLPGKGKRDPSKLNPSTSNTRKSDSPPTEKNGEPRRHGPTIQRGRLQQKVGPVLGRNNTKSWGETKNPVYLQTVQSVQGKNRGNVGRTRHEKGDSRALSKKTHRRVKVSSAPETSDPRQKATRPRRIIQPEARRLQSSERA